MKKESYIEELYDAKIRLAEARRIRAKYLEELM